MAGTITGPSSGVSPSSSSRRRPTTAGSAASTAGTPPQTWSLWTRTSSPFCAATCSRRAVRSSAPGFRAGTVPGPPRPVLLLLLPDAALCPRHTELRICAGDTFFARSTQRTWTRDDLYRLRWHHRRPAPCQDGCLLSQGTILQDAHRALGVHLWARGPAGLPHPVPDFMSGVDTRLGPYKVPWAHQPVEPGV